jgi:hypothetical protein
VIDILEEFANYLATTLTLEPGVSIAYNEMPDVGTKCVVVQAPRLGGYVAPQIDADTHNIQVVAREATNVLAQQLAMQCYTALLTEDGFVDLSHVRVSIELQGTPIWQQTDQQARKYYYFQMKVISKRLN